MMHFQILLGFCLCASTLGAISTARNVKVTPKLQSESTAVIFTWEVPENLDGNSEGDLEYEVKYCEINNAATCKTGTTADKRYEASGLKKNFLYSYHIFAIANGARGDEWKQIFRTKGRDTCAPNMYTCTRSTECVEPHKKCDGIINCRDGSDENSDAGCNVPVEKPSAVEVVDVKDTSFVVKFRQVHAKERATEYEVEVVDAATNGKVTRKDKHVPFSAVPKSVPVTGLNAGTEYKIRVRAFNRVGAGAFSDDVTAKTTGTAGAGIGITQSGALKVENVKASPKPLQETSAFILTWDAPSNLGSNTEADLKYIVKYCEINRASTCKKTRISTDKRAEITGLKPNFIYSYHITVFDKSLKPGAEYKQIYKTKGKKTCLPNQFTCTRSAQCVEARMKCDGIVNCADGSDEGADAQCTVPGAKPTAVEVVDVKDNSFVVKFRQVHAKERATEYEVEIVDTATNGKITKKDKHVPFSAVPKSVPVTGLKGGTEYKVKVRAVNRVGAGAFSDDVTAKTTGTAGAAAPGGALKVENVKASPKPLQETSAFILTWDAPSNLGSNTEADLKYVVKYCEINRPSSCKKTRISTDKRAEITGLKINFIYSYHINVFDKTLKPGAEYKQVYKTKGKNTCLPNQFTCTRSNQCVDLRMRCDGLVNCADGSDEGADAQCTVPGDKPKGVEVVDVKDTSFVVKFQQVHPRNRATEYEVEIMETATGGKTVRKAKHIQFSAVPKSVPVTGLKGGTEYKVKVRAVNRVGAGSFSDDVTAKTTGATSSSAALGAVTNVEVAPKPLSETSAVVVQWSAPAGAPSGVKYTVKYCEINRKSTCKTTDANTDTRVDLKGLKKNFLYSYHITALSADNTPGTSYDQTFRTGSKRTCLPNQFACRRVDGCIPASRRCDGITNCGDASDEGEHAECTRPQSVPTGIAIEPSTSSLKFKYTQVPQRDRATSYDIEIVDTTDGTTTSRASTHEQYGINFKTIDIQGLKALREYKLRIRANNRVGSGPWSQFESVKTTGVGEVSNVKFTSTQNTARLVWASPTKLNGENPSTFSYIIKYCALKEGEMEDCKEIKTKDKHKTIRNLKPSTSYSFEIFSLNANNEQSAVFKKRISTEIEEFRTIGGGGSEESGMSTAQKAGIAIGIVLVIIIIIVAVFICMRSRKSKKGNNQAATNGKQNNGYEMDRK